MTVTLLQFKDNYIFQHFFFYLDDYSESTAVFVLRPNMTTICVREVFTPFTKVKVGY